MQVNFHVQTNTQLAFEDYTLTGNRGFVCLRVEQASEEDFLSDSVTFFFGHEFYHKLLEFADAAETAWQKTLPLDEKVGELTTIGKVS